MKSMLVLAILMGVGLATVIPHVGPIVTHTPLTYRVNLEDPPEVRWAPMIQDYAVPLKRFMEYFELLPISKVFWEGVDYYAKNVYQQKEFVREVDAISKLSNYSFDKLFFLNFMYEFSTFKACTGILVRNSEGKVMHGRNLDF
jgi:acid ceramidase/N-acylethanolamine-hydrolysing acid amidase